MTPLSRLEQQLLTGPWHEARPGVQVKPLPRAANSTSSPKALIGSPGSVPSAGANSGGCRPGYALAPGLTHAVFQTLAMAVHELATNAVKHGALKQPNGHLTVRWWREIGEGGKPWLHVDWKESGVEMPSWGAGTGQGRELIERALRYQFGAQTTFTLEADGVHRTISLPASEREVTDADYPVRVRQMPNKGKAMALADLFEEGLGPAA